MYLDERSGILLNEVLQHLNITAEKLQTKFNLTRRQLDYSFGKINSWLEKQGLPKIHRGTNGYFVIDPDLFVLISLAQEKEIKKQRYLPSVKERASLIILMLTISRKQLSLNHFIDELTVSKNTVLNDFRFVQSILDNYSLTAKYSRKNGYLIEGDEWNQRVALIDAIEHILRIFGGEVLLQHFMGISKSTIAGYKKKLECVEKHLNLHFIDSKIQVLPYIFEAIFCRIDMERTIATRFLIDYRELSDTREYNAAEILIDGRQNISEAERIYVTLQLLTSNVLTNEHLKSEEMPKLKQVLQQVLFEFERKAVIQLVDKDSLIEKIYSHIKPAYYRIKYNLTTDYNVLNDIDQEFKVIHRFIKQSLLPLEEFIGAKIPENESVFISLLLAGHLQEISKTPLPQKKAVIVCPNSQSILKLIEKTLRNIFPEIFFYQGMSVREFEQTGLPYDLVFSTVSVTTDKMIFLIKQMMKEKEKLELRRRVIHSIYKINTNAFSVDEWMKMISKYTVIKEPDKLEKALAEYISPIIEDAELQNEAKKTLSDLLPTRHIIRVKSVDNWLDSIRIAAQPLLESGAISQNYIDEMCHLCPIPTANLILRTTIAIPHAELENGVNELSMCFLHIEDGLPLEQGGTLHFVTVIAAVDTSSHFTALLQLMDLAESPRTLKKIASSQSINEIHDQIRMFITKKY